MLITWLAACSEYGISNVQQEPDTPPSVATADTAPLPPEGDVEEKTVPVAVDPVYANTAGELFAIDPQTGERESVGEFRDANGPVGNMVDIAIDLSGRMYGGNFEALYQIDPTTAQVSYICDLAATPSALTFTSDDVLFAGADDEVVELDPATCAFTPLTPAGNYTTSGDLVGLPDGFLYWTVFGPGTDELVKVDPVTGATFLVGPIGEDQIFGLGYAKGSLFGFSSRGGILRIDPQTAEAVDLQRDTTSWWGATTNPVKW